MFDRLAEIESHEKIYIRSLSRVLFARSFVPEAFSSYVEQNSAGELRLLREPADSDPMMQRVARIQARNDLFVDVLQDYYRSFNSQMELPYQEWRKLSYKETPLRSAMGRPS